MTHATAPARIHARTPAFWIPAFSIFGVLLTLLLPLAVCGRAFGADASPWDGDARVAVRLLTGSRPAGGPLRAGVQFRLADGWKTYWRYPGDSGVPPVFDFSKSENIRSVSVLWPAPHRFVYDGVASIGYKGEVIFPLHVVLEDPSRPAILRLALDYMICENICIPERGKAELAVPSAASPYDSKLAAAEARVPRPAQVGEKVGANGDEASGEASALGVTAVRLEPARPHARVIVDVIATANVPLDVFAEGPTPEWALPLPEPVPGAPPGHQWFAFDLDGMPPSVDGTGAPLRFTVVSGENAVEVTAVPK